MTMDSTARTNRHGSATVTLEGDTGIIIARSFDAPADLVFRAWTTPELVRRWWGFSEDDWVVCDIDLRVGGQWRYVINHHGDDGDFEVGFHGEYAEIDAPRRLVSTEVFEGMPDAHSDNVMTFDEVDGVTTMTTVITHTCQEHRDGHIASGMEGGMQVSMDRLEDVVAQLAA